MGLFPVGPEEKEAEATKTASLISCLLQDATRSSAHLLPLRFTKDQDKGSLPPFRLLLSSRHPGLLQILPSDWWCRLLPKILQRLSKKTTG